MRFQTQNLWTGIFLSGALLLAGNPTLAQGKQASGNVFATLAFTVGSHVGGRVAVDLKTKSNWSVGMVGGFFSSTARQLPADYALKYRRGFFSSGPQKLNDVGVFTAFTIGRSIALRGTKAWHTRIGPSVNRVSVYENFRPGTAYTFSVLGSGSPYDIYNYDENVYHPVGLYLASAVEFATSQSLGITLGLSANLNAARSQFGLDLGILFGNPGERNNRFSPAPQP